MDLVIRGKNIEVSEEVKAYVNKKVKKFDRHLPNISKTKVEFSEEKTQSKENRYIVEVTIESQGNFLRGEQRGPDMFFAIDTVADNMDRQIRRYKERMQGKKRRVSPPTKGENAANNITEAAVEGEVETFIKVKRFHVKPMSVDDAVDQMEWLAHDFFVFFDAESERFNVLYRRKSGGYGLIEPELE